MNYKKYGLAIAIAIVFVAFVNVAIDTFYSQPEYRDCYTTVKTDLGDIERQNQIDEERKECEEENKPIRDFYNRNVFLILSIIGIIALFLGFYLKIDSVSLGFVIAGIISILEGIIRYWSGMAEYFRLIILGLLLGLLIFVGYRYINK